MSFDVIKKFEHEIADFFGSPYAVATDCCTHAIELALRVTRPTEVKLTAYTYLSIPMLFHKLGIDYEFIDENGMMNIKFMAPTFGIVHGFLNQICIGLA